MATLFLFLLLVSKEASQLHFSYCCALFSKETDFSTSLELAAFTVNSTFFPPLTFALHLGHLGLLLVVRSALPEKDLLNTNVVTSSNYVPF